MRMASTGKRVSGNVTVKKHATAGAGDRRQTQKSEMRV